MSSRKRKVRPLPKPPPPAPPPARKRWLELWESKRPILRLVLGFVALMAAYYAATLTPFFLHSFFPTYLGWTARVSSALLNALGQATSVSGASISGGGFSVDVRRGCEAIEPSVIFVAALLAFPSPLRPKLPCLVVGGLILQALNVVRVVSLFLIGRYFPRAFEAMHVEVWQTVFIAVAVLLCVLSLQWMVRPRPQAPAANAPG